MAAKSPVPVSPNTTADTAVAAVTSMFGNDYAMVADSFDRVMSRILCPDDHLDAADREALATLHMTTMQLRTLAKEMAHA